MENKRLAAYALGIILTGYLTGCFVNISFDISKWSHDARSITAILSIIVVLTFIALVKINQE